MPKPQSSSKLQKLADAYKQVFGSDAGRMVLADLLTRCHVLGSTFEPGDPTTTSFREGERNVALHICAMLALDPEHFERLYEQTREEYLRWSND